MNILQRVNILNHIEYIEKSNFSPELSFYKFACIE